MSVLATLIQTYPSWDALKTYLTSKEGGALTVYEEAPFAMIRYVKEQSDMTLPHVGAFRSVVWNMETNRPVSVTAFKSETGEGFPSSTEMIVEEFVDGVMIGQFWDGAKWRIHTRSVIDAQCRYFSKRSFAELFEEAVAASEIPPVLDPAVCYTWILQHPENRVVCPVQKPRLVLVAAYTIESDGTLKIAEVPSTFARPVQYFTKSETANVGCMQMGLVLDVIGMVNKADHEQTSEASASSCIPTDIPGVISMLATMRGSVRHQGVVIKIASEPFKRWKIRSQVYNQVRKMRGNTARRDFLWMDMWSKGTLEDYLKYFPEERRPSDDLIQRWKDITQTVFKTYIDGFKARTLDRSQIPAKIRPLVYGLHNLYMNTLKPTHKTLDWRAVVHWMNDRDTAQKIFVLNWDLRQEKSLRLEPAPTMSLRQEKDEKVLNEDR